MRNVAVILAGGSGERFGSSVPKQFLQLAGKKVIEYSIRAFDNNCNIDEIVVVVNIKYIDFVHRICNKNKFKKVKYIIEGGENRNHSSFKALSLYAKYLDYNILFHDAVRPFISNNVINEVISSLDKYEAIDTAIPVSDTIIKVDKDNKIVDIPNRKFLKAGHTPQGFKVKIILKAYNKFLNDKDKFDATDDCGIVKKYLKSVPIHVVESEIKNIKITHALDLDIADKIFQLNLQNHKNKSAKMDLDIFFKNKIVVIFGGTSGIGKSIADKLKKSAMNVTVVSKSQGTDIRNEDNIANVFDSVYKKFGHIDLIINTAAILRVDYLRDMDSSVIKEILDVNILGSFLISKHSYKYLRATKGQLILFGSSSYSRGRKKYAIYSASKAAIVNMTQALADEWSEVGIKINCINPQRTKTRMRVQNFGKERDDTLLDPEEVADETINLIIQEVTGQIINISK